MIQLLSGITTSTRPRGGSYEVTTSPAAFPRQPVSVTTTRPTTSVGSYEGTTRPDAFTRQPVSVTTTRPTTSVGSYEVTTSPAAFPRQPVSVTTTRPTTSGGSYEGTTSSAAYTRQPVNVTTSRPTTDVTTRLAASQYEPVTEVPKHTAPGYETLAGSSTHGMDFSGLSEASQSPSFCHIEKKVEFMDQCETYKEETCYTLNKEKCTWQVLRDCRPVLKTRVEEVCLNVTNKFCTLVESEERVQLEEVIFGANCSRGIDQVCDQSYRVEVTDLEQEVCVNLDTVNCIQESILVSDTVCVE